MQLQQALFKLCLSVGNFHVVQAFSAKASGISAGYECTLFFCQLYLLALAAEDRTNTALKSCITAGTVDGFMTSHKVKLRIR
ncbi:hypothetical protein SAMN05216311_10180 [Chitinophaga sp. CF418]|nr:hypothetical protein SAMN05216311_10180 [Chitinophaga sp. CF418]